MKHQTGNQTRSQEMAAPNSSAALVLVMGVATGAEDAVRAVLSDLTSLSRTVRVRAPKAELTCVVGIGSQLWDRLFAGSRPAELHPFTELDGGRHRAVATPGDLILHIRAARTDVCFELATLIQTALADACTVIDEVHGFRYFDQRDLLGFVDGTENPDGPDVADTILVGDEDREFAGGAYLLVQKYLHNMRGWEQLTVEEQENVVGRTKLSNVELPEDRMPPNSHVSLTSIETDDGTELQIVRDNVAFGSHARGEFGTYFIGYSRSPAVSERMLRNMFLGDPLGNVDRILDFSTPVSGIQFFIPSRDFLNNLPPLPGPTAVELAQGR